MYVDIGKVKPGSTVFVPWHAFDSNDPSESTTISGLAVTDIEIFKNASMTQRASDSGFALIDTDGIDLDGITGIGGVTLDLSDNTDAGFYTVGADYVVVIAGIVVDTGTVNFIGIRFRIGYEGALHETTIATLASQTSFTLTAGSANNNAYVGWKAIIHDIASDFQLCLGYVSTYTGASRTVGLTADPAIFTMAAGDNISLFPPDNVHALVGSVANAANLNSAAANYSATRGLSGTALPNAAADAAGGLPVSDSGGLDLDTLFTNLESALADTNELQTDWEDGGRLDLLIDAIKAVTDAIPNNGAMTSVAQGSDLAVVDAIVDAILVDTDTTIPALISALNNVSVSDILTSQMTESYAANGSAPTLAEAIFAIHQMLMSFVIAGTSLTVRRLDNSTTAFIVTLNDATNPTGNSRS